MPPSCGVKNLADGNSMAKYLAILVLWRIILSGECIRRKFFRGRVNTIHFGDSWARYLLAVMCLEGSLEEIFPDKVTRGMCYMEMAAKGNFPQAVEFMEKQKPKHQ